MEPRPLSIGRGFCVSEIISKLTATYAEKGRCALDHPSLQALHACRIWREQLQLFAMQQSHITGSDRHYILKGES